MVVFVQLSYSSSPDSGHHSPVCAIGRANPLFFQVIADDEDEGPEEVGAYPSLNVLSKLPQSLCNKAGLVEPRGSVSLLP